MTPSKDRNAIRSDDINSQLTRQKKIQRCPRVVRTDGLRGGVVFSIAGGVAVDEESNEASFVAIVGLGCERKKAKGEMEVGGREKEET